MPAPGHPLQSEDRPVQGKVHVAERLHAMHTSSDLQSPVCAHKRAPVNPRSVTLNDVALGPGLQQWEQQQLGWLTHQRLQHGKLLSMLLNESSKLIQQQGPCLHVQHRRVKQGHLSACARALEVLVHAVPGCHSFQCVPFLGLA